MLVVIMARLPVSPGLTPRPSLSVWELVYSVLSIMDVRGA